MEEIMQNYLDLKSEMDDISDERKEKTNEMKDLEDKIKTYLEKSPDKCYEHEGSRVYLTEVSSVKALNRDSLERMLVVYFEGNASKAKSLAEYIWTNREKDTKTVLKVGKATPRKKQKK